MKRSWILLCALFPFSPQLLANGGGYTRGGVESAGDLAGFQPESTENIRIVDEKLDIGVGPKLAKVGIRYLMRNETDQVVKVRFGFPIEELADIDPYNQAMVSMSEQTSGLKYCQDYRIFAKGEPIQAKWKEEVKPAADSRFTGIAGWLVSEIRFEPREEIPVTIGFNSVYPLSEGQMSVNTYTAAAVFKYRLSTAACWAGTIGTGRIVLHPDGIPASDLKVIKPVNRFKKEGVNWVWNFKDLEPTLADDIEIEPRPAERTFSHQFLQSGQKWAATHRNYTVTASSVLKPEGKIHYDGEKLKDSSARTAWSEGAEGSGVGEWLELKPEVAKPLVGLNLQPGLWGNVYESGDSDFKANARPKKIRVELNGDYSMTVDVPDQCTDCKIRFGDYTKPVETIRLTFEEVWEGSKYEDLCVSGIQLHALLDHKPELPPSR